ncbi:MAG TPA: hypothetical protein VJY62_17145 [Bacteroidia bacterium]|nr:hypothetical protein [Bacteroidia bacterium]
MKKILALLLSLLLVHCELHDTFAQIFKAGSECGTSCCSKQCGSSDTSKKSKDDCSKSPGSDKNCCTSCCCYLPVYTSGIVVSAGITEISFPQNFFYTHFFSADCFHPPEIIGFT